MKYIMFEVEMKLPNDEKQIELMPIIFPKNLTHSIVAKFIKQAIRSEDLEIRENDNFRTATAVSAGFVNIMNGMLIKTYGMSETMELDSRPEDAIIISNIDYFPFKNDSL